MKPQTAVLKNVNMYVTLHIILKHKIKVSSLDRFRDLVIVRLTPNLKYMSMLLNGF